METMLPPAGRECLLYRRLQLAGSRRDLSRSGVPLGQRKERGPYDRRTIGLGGGPV